jgi:S1-C subfamily serine protease
MIACFSNISHNEKKGCSMRKSCVAVLVFLLFVFSSPAHAAQTAEEILKAIVQIRSIIPKDAHTAATLGTEREGSGVIIDTKGYILTIGYLVVEAENIEVIGLEEKPVTARFVGYDHTTGFGLIKTEKPLNVAPMKIGKSSEVKEGDPILVAGHGGADAVQVARVISRKEFTGYWEYLLEDAIFTAPAYANFGGAALIGQDGQLLGIGSLFTQMMIPGLASIPSNVFVPIDLLGPILSDLKTIGRSSKAPKPWLGVNAEEAHGRVFITRLTPGSPAEKAGIRPGDLILTVNKSAVTGLADFYRKVWALGKPGAEIPLGVLQGIEIRSIRVRSGDRYQFLKLKPDKRI